MGWIDKCGQFGYQVDKRVSKAGGAKGEPMSAGAQCQGIHLVQKLSVLSAFSLPALTCTFSLQHVFEQQGHRLVRYGLVLGLLGVLNDSTVGSDHPRQDEHATSNIQRNAM